MVVNHSHLKEGQGLWQATRSEAGWPSERPHGLGISQEGLEDWAGLWGKLLAPSEGAGREAPLPSTDPPLSPWGHFGHLSLGPSKQWTRGDLGCQPVS